MKMREKLRKRPKLCKKSENLCYKIQSNGFLLLNIMDQIFKISTIVETLVTLARGLSNINDSKIKINDFKL